MSKKKKSRQPVSYVTVVLIATAVVTALVLLLTLVESTGIAGRLNRAAKSDHFSLNENEMDVYRYHIGRSKFCTEYMYLQYGIIQDTQGITKVFSAPEQYAEAMLPRVAGTHAFDDDAYPFAEQYLTYCEGAREAGLYDGYVQETEEDVEQYLDTMREQAEAEGVSLSKYMRTSIGKGIGKKDVRKAMSFFFAGNKYREKLLEDFRKAAGTEELEKYRDDHKDRFYTSKYTAYKLINNDLHEALDRCGTIGEVKTLVLDYFLNMKFEDLYREKIEQADPAVTDPSGKEKTRTDVRTTLLAMNDVGEHEAVFKSDDTDPYKKAAYGVAEAIRSSASAELANIREGVSAPYADPTSETATDLQKWLFGDGRKKDDTRTIREESKSQGPDGKDIVSETYTWYLVEDAMVIDKEKTRNAYYVQFRDKAGESSEGGMTAAEKAAAMYAEFEKDPTPEKFAELAAKYASGASSTLRERIPSKALPDKAADWLYAKERKKGDTADVQTDDAGHYVFLYEGENEETWIMNARDGVAEEKRIAWYDDAVERYHVTVDHEAPTTPPTDAPSETAEAPSGDASEVPSEAPSEAPSGDPSSDTSETPTEVPTETPTNLP